MNPPDASPFEAFLARQDFVALDGGLATELEARGFALGTRLWSAQALLDAPELIGAVHRAYLEAGADCIATATYQATPAGFTDAGLGPDEGGRLLLEAVRLATAARDDFWAVDQGRTGRLRPLVAASIGPYGAYLADGSEYRGVYELDEDALVDFHRGRLLALAASEADLLALETIPSLAEARALSRLLNEVPDSWAWISFSCPDGTHLADGSRLGDAVRAVERAPRLAAIGVNCVAPRHVEGLVREVRSATAVPVVAYPNSGERWDATSRAWADGGEAADWGTEVRAWTAAGATVIGGCCRVGPARIAELRDALVASA